MIRGLDEKALTNAGGARGASRGARAAAPLATPVVLLLALLATALTLAACKRSPIVYRGGPILTMDAGDRVVDAIAIDGDRIVAVGREADVAPWIRGGATVVDLGGRALLPGFVDAHSHFPLAGFAATTADLASPPMGTVVGMDDLVRRLADRAQHVSSGGWVVGRGYDDSLLTENRHPTRHDLDRVSTTHPVAAFHVSGQLAAVNTRALALLGIDRNTPDPEGGRIRREAGTSEPDGVLEKTATEPVFRKILWSSPVDALRIARYATALYTAEGVTTAQDGHASQQLFRALSWLSRLDVIRVRLVLWPDETTSDALLDGSFSFESHHPEWVRLGARQLIADGSIYGYTSYLTQPYYREPPGMDASYRGYPRMTRDDLFAHVARYHAAGLQVAVHASGDAAIDDVLDAIEAAQHAYPRPDARHVIVHAQVARDDQLDRMKALGVIPSFFGLHVYYWGDQHRDTFLGPERAARISPAASAAARGLRFTLHADTPVTPMEPLRMVWTAVNRRTRSGTVLGPEERIDVRRALRAVTIDAAYELFQERETGSLEVGKLADLVVLDRSPLDDPEHIDQIRVTDTIIGGRHMRKPPPDVAVQR